MEIEKLSLLLAYFLIYSFLGWLLESIYKSILQKKIVNSGFIMGPFCPIYGFGALILYICLEQFKDNLVLLFISGVIIFSIWEYFVGYVLEKIFNTKYWDYSNEFCNLNGRICLKMSLAWGFLGVLFTYILHPFISSLVEKIPLDILEIIISLLFIYLIIDVVTSAIKIQNINIRLNKLRDIQDLLNVKIKQIKELTYNNIKIRDLKVISNKKYQLTNLKKTVEELKNKENVLVNKLNKKIERLKKAFPTMKSQSITYFLNQKIDSIKKDKKER